MQTQALETIQNHTAGGMMLWLQRFLVPKKAELHSPCATITTTRNTLGTVDQRDTFVA
jgi:hypothetical protein